MRRRRGAHQALTPSFAPPSGASGSTHTFFYSSHPVSRIRLKPLKTNDIHFSTRHTLPISVRRNFARRSALTRRKERCRSLPAASLVTRTATARRAGGTTAQGTTTPGGSEGARSRGRGRWIRPRRGGRCSSGRRLRRRRSGRGARRGSAGGCLAFPCR